MRIILNYTKFKAIKSVSKAVCAFFAQVQISSIYSALRIFFYT